MKTTSILIASAAFAVAAFAAEEPEQNMPLDKIPAPAAQAIQKLSDGAKIEQTSKETDHEKVVYEAKFTKDGHTREVSVDASGKLVSDEETVSLSETPEAVRAAIETEARGGRIEKVERITEDGKLTFEALVSGKNKREEIVIAPDGKIIERENKSGEKEND